MQLFSPTSPALRRLTRILESAGWEIQFLDLNLASEIPTVDLRLYRTDGLWLHVRADHLGRCTLETFSRRKWLGMTQGVKGRKPLSPQVEDTFLGRRRFTGVRMMMRELCAYLVENAQTPVALGDMRNAWRVLFSIPNSTNLGLAPFDGEWSNA